MNTLVYTIQCAHRIPLQQIIVALGLKPPGTVLKRLRNRNQNVDTQLGDVSRHPRVSTLKHKIKQGTN